MRQDKSPGTGRQGEPGTAPGASRKVAPLRRWCMALAFGLLLGAGAPLRPAGALDALDTAARATLVRALDAAERQQWPVARAAIDELGSPLLRTYLVWRELADGSSPIAFDRYRAFLARFADWPRLGTIRANAELRIDGSVDYATRRAFFAERRPQTRQGRIRLAEAELAIGDRARGQALVRQSWTDDNFSQSEEGFFLDQFRHLLTPGDHAGRLHRLLWDGRATEARRMLRRVDRGTAALAEARLALQDAAPGVDRLVLAVPQSLQRDPGLLYDRLRWRRLKGRDADAREILLAPPDQLGRPAAWWNERAYQIREALAADDFPLAYRLAQLHGQTAQDGVGFAEAEWLVGWLALRHAGDARRALGHFARMYDAVATPISRSRAGYWAGRAAAAMGDGRATERWYRLAADHPTTYYGQLALDELGQPLRLTDPVAGGDGPDGVDRDFESSALVRLTRLFCTLELARHAVPFLQRLMLDWPDKAAVLRLAHDCGRPDIVVELAKHGVSAAVLDPLASFPVPAHHGLLQPTDSAIEPALLLAVARQESHFDPTAESPAGAVGLMQVMPATGRAVAEQLGLPWSLRRLHRDPHYNAQIGARYLGMLNERFGGRLELMAAAYNAGPPRVTAWLARHGDPRALDRHGAVDWVELIPFRETRNYVQRVIESRNVYRELLTAPAIRPVSFVVDRGPLVPPPMPRRKPRVH